ncbi:MAG: beta galactosidase jelly roll domain-containing protein [Parabacteroides sp.]|nr:beta galactosidase jelly roll domain-containing protein [Parabacteroides sp.]
MNYLYSLFLLPLLPLSGATAQEIRLTETARSEQVYADSVTCEELLSFNELGVESGYVLYRAAIEINRAEPVLELENVRDYAAVYLDDRLQGTVTATNKKQPLSAAPGKYMLSLYAENIGRITYGPEISDNSKGLFGRILLDGKEIGNWTILPLNVPACNVKQLLFREEAAGGLPSFHRGHFRLEAPCDTHLDVSGWGMGEVWVNGVYVGSYWDEEQLQSLPVPAGILLKGTNELVVFDLKSRSCPTMRLCDAPVFN